MDAFFNFASNHPFTAWLLAWGLWPICWTVRAILVAPFSYTVSAYRRRLRHLDIQKHGWPTARHMNADGDVIHPEPRNNG